MTPPPPSVRRVLPVDRRKVLPVLTPEATRERQLNQARRISRIAFAAVVLGMITVLGRVIQIQVSPNPALAKHVDQGFSQRVELARRGDLLDRRGRVIASSVIGHRLFIDPQFCDDVDTIALTLADVLRTDPMPIDRTITKALERVPDRRYVVVMQDVTPRQAAAVRQANIKGVGLTEKLVRRGTANDLAAPVVGLVGYDQSGLAGAENRFDDRLQPTNGSIRFLRDKKRRPLWIEAGDYDPRKDGTAVRLSLDLVIQAFVEERLEQAIIDHAARGARMVVMDPHTGEILALHDVLNLEFDRGVIDKRESAFGPAALRPNRCVADAYEPGSTFKPFVWAVATELGRAVPEDKLPTPSGYGWVTPYGRLVKDSHYYGPSTWRRVLVKSMNTGMAMIAERLSHAEMQDIVSRFGFGQRTYAGIPGEATGQVTSPANWNLFTQTSVAMGHEVSVNTLQMARAFSVFARDGTMPTLRITARESRNAGVRYEHRIIKESTALQVREILGDVVTQGTGRDAQSKLYRLFGKSGTAELWDNDLGQYHRDRYTSSFIAGAPMDVPQLVILCVIDDPDKEVAPHGGGHSAGPVVRDVMDFALTYLGVKPDQPVGEQAD